MSTIESETLTSLEPMILSIASEFGRRHRSAAADASDFAQTIYLWLFDNAEKVNEYLDGELYSPDHGERMLAKSMRNACKNYALELDAQRKGYKRDDLYFYKRGEVRALLPMIFDQEKWHEPPQSDGRSAKSYAEGGNWVATLADVSQAFARMSKDDRLLLTRFHKEGRTNQVNAQFYEVSEQTMSYRHDQAIKRLLDLLGGDEPGRGRAPERSPWVGRSAISNSHAQAMTKATYDDE